MTNHPSLQPVLAAGNVAMLTRYMEALAPPNGDLMSDDYLAGYRAGVRAAVHLVNDMWSAAVIATDAVNLEMMQDVYPGDDDGATRLFRSLREKVVYPGDDDGALDYDDD